MFTEEQIQGDRREYPVFRSSSLIAIRPSATFSGLTQKSTTVLCREFLRNSMTNCFWIKSII